MLNTFKTTKGKATTTISNTNTNKNNTITIYPNSAHTTITIQFTIASNATIKLMDITGKVLQEQSVSNTLQTTLKISGYEQGKYIYQVVTSRGVKVGKIVIV